MLTDALEREFGASWRRGPALGPAAVEAFEQEHGVALPEPYRTFVMSVANGAAGPPDFGLVPLGHPSDNSDAPHSVTPGSLRRPFPLTEVWIWESDPNADTERVSAVHRDGFVPLGTDGDGMDYVLVVTGAVRGQVWMVTGEGAVPIAADFGRWLEGDVLPDGEFTLDTRRERTGKP